VNPFAPPRSDTTLVPTPPSRRIAWKVYAFAVAAVQLVGLLFALPKMGVAEALDYGVTTVALTGLFGYAFRRPVVGPLFGRRIWMVLSVFIPLWDVAMGAWIYPRQSGTGVEMEYFVAMLLFLPQYLALVRYAYSSRELWRR